MLGFPTLYLKGMRIVMFQLSGFYYRGFGVLGFRPVKRPLNDLIIQKREPAKLCRCSDLSLRN